MTPDAMTPNAMTPNAMTPNAMTPNAMTPNAMTPNAMTPTGTPSPAPAAARRTGGLALTAAAVLAAAVTLTAVGGGLVDNVAADSATGGWGLALGVVGELLAAVVLAACRRTTGVWPGRLGAVGAWSTAGGLAAMALGGVATLVTGDHEALGLVYVAGALVSFVGAVVLAVASWRARVLPRALMVLFALAFVPLLPPVVVLLAVVALAWLGLLLLRA